MEGILLRYEEKSFVFLIAKTMGQKKRSAPLNDGNLWHHCYMHMIVAIVSGKWWTESGSALYCVGATRASPAHNVRARASVSVMLILYH